MQTLVRLTIYMSEKILMSLYDEIVKIRQLLEMTVRNDLTKELESILTTKERKMIWSLCDGFTNTKTIAETTGISMRAVQIAVKDLQDAGLLIARRRGFPRRKFDYVPATWNPKKKGEILESTT